MAEATFTDPPRTPQATQLRLWPLLVLVLVLVLGLGGAAVVYVRAKARAPVAQPAADVGGWPSWMQQPPVYAAPKAPAPPPPPPPQERATVTIPTMPGPPAGLPPPPGEPVETGTRGTPAPPQVKQPKQPSAPPAKHDDRPPVRKWLFAEMQESKRKPFTKRSGQPPRPEGRAPGPEGAPAQDEPEGAGPAGTLITPARWEVPADRTKVLYPSMAIYAALEHDVNSDVPGEVRMVVVQDVPDLYMQGNILIPQYTHLFASQDGVPSYGQGAINLKVRLGQTPGGVMIDFTKTVAQDGTGQAGLRGSVDYHWVQVGAAAILTALMSTATQSLVSQRGTFYPSFEEEAARNAARSLEKSGNDIVRRELQRPPTVRLKHGDPVMIQLKEAISLQTHPAVVAR